MSTENGLLTGPPLPVNLLRAGNTSSGIVVLFVMGIILLGFPYSVGIRSTSTALVGFALAEVRESSKSETTIRIGIFSFIAHSLLKICFLYLL